ncbi:DinB family protein [Staphylococcus shinii]|uniref:DinB family protein n=1 Tax=Staphylococcus shinii TaxID=2912228 RepID=UPI000D1DFC1B|nr:DinB family protein [Staphylococcus shinii]PTI61565.1 damage-inducible protein DinB [Staphylococcus shinii]
MDLNEYEWVKQNRNILLEQCSILNENEFSKEFDFGFQSIKKSLIHIAGCYHAWLGSFVLEKTKTPLFTSEEIEELKIDDIKQYFLQADNYMEDILKRSSNELDNYIEKSPAWKQGNESIMKTVRQLLFHSVTHEYHHKGQIVTMLRMLGYTPNNTDVLFLYI